MRLELFIPQYLPKLPNTLLGAHWRVRSSHAKKWKRLVGDALVAGDSKTWGWALSGNAPLKKARITLTRCSPRQCDFDGLVGSMKCILDALVHHNVIADDTPEHVTCEYIWTKTPTKEQGIHITVESV